VIQGPNTPKRKDAALQLPNQPTNQDDSLLLGGQRARCTLDEVRHRSRTTATEKTQGMNAKDGSERVLVDRKCIRRKIHRENAAICRRSSIARDGPAQSTHNAGLYKVTQVGEIITIML